MCNKSESIVKIASALVAFSGKVKSIEKDSTNPHFKSKYTSLDHMIDETKPLLHELGLAIMQFPGGDGEKITVRTMIIHSSGEWMETEPLTLKAVKTDPQGAGSAITYGRRYSYAAALSLSLGDDDDGNASSTPPRTAQQPTQANIPPNTQSAPQTNLGAPPMVSEAQVKYIGSLKSQKKVPDDEFRKLIAPKSSTKDLTVAEAKQLINTLQAYVPPVIDIDDRDLPF
jgi:hypothetical protein